MMEQGYAKRENIEDVNSFCRRLNAEGWQVKQLIITSIRFEGALVERSNEKNS